MDDRETTDRLEEEVRKALAALLAHTARLRELPLEGVEPAPPTPDWK
jgi:hypothetical protein